MDPNRAADIRRAAEIRSQVYEKARKERRQFERADPFRQIGKGGRRSSANGGGFLSSLGAFLIMIAMFRWIGDREKSVPETVASSTVTGPQDYRANPVESRPDRHVVDVVSDSSMGAASGQPGPVNTALIADLPGESDSGAAGPIIVSAPAPRYPSSARREGSEGTTVLLIMVGLDGTVEDVAIDISSGHRDLDKAALQAAKRWKFSPATSGTEPVFGSVRVPISFSL